MSETNLLPPVTLILGGARSGKSLYAERLVKNSGLEPCYLATAISGDEEMAERIRLHRERRGDSWTTIEEPIDLVGALTSNSNSKRAILVDCLTLWLSNLMTLSRNIETESSRLVSALPDMPSPVVFVSNEVGLGIVPANDLARSFRDHAGHLHQAVAETANNVVFMMAGLPMNLTHSE